MLSLAHGAAGMMAILPSWSQKFLQEHSLTWRQALRGAVIFLANALGSEGTELEMTRRSVLGVLADAIPEAVLPASHGCLAAKRQGLSQGPWHMVPQRIRSGLAHLPGLRIPREARVPVPLSVRARNPAPGH